MITCDHCGTAIDVEKSKRCPNCGASYANNKDYKEYKNHNSKSKEYDLREREANIKQKEIENDMLEKQSNVSNNAFKLAKIIIIAICIIFVIIFIMHIVFSFNIFKKLF